MTKQILAPLIAIASDHAGIELKTLLVQELRQQGYEVSDLGTDGQQSVDYPDYANAAAEWIRKNTDSNAILICGSGIGMSMAANRHKHIRAALCHSGLEAQLSRRHNNANVLCLGARIIGSESAKDCVTQFLNTKFEGGRHENRLTKFC